MQVDECWIRYCYGAIKKKARKRGWDLRSGDAASDEVWFRIR